MSVILVADDDPDIVDLVRLRLEREGHEVLAAADGEEAWRLAQEHAPDLAVLDIAMPRLDGLQLTRLLRAHGPTSTIVVLIVSAAVHDRDRQAALDAGADDHVRKPFSPKALAVRVGELLSR